MVISAGCPPNPCRFENGLRFSSMVMPVYASPAKAQVRITLKVACLVVQLWRLHQVFGVNMRPEREDPMHPLLLSAT